MSDLESNRQSDNITPPEGGAQIAITLDATAQKYDLWNVAIGRGTVAPSQDGTAGAVSAKDAYVYVKLIADVDFYCFFSKDNSLTIDNASSVAVGGAVVFTANACDLIPAKTPEHIRINRTEHRWLYVKGTGAGTLRLRASSHPSAKAAVL